MRMSCGSVVVDASNPMNRMIYLVCRLFVGTGKERILSVLLHPRLGKNEYVGDQRSFGAPKHVKMPIAIL